MLIKACLNGRRVALSADELATEAAAAVAAGAGALHVHPRDASGEESLHADDIASALEAIRGAAPGVPVGVSTGAWIEPDPAERQELVGRWTVLPDFASVNFGEGGAEALARLLLDRGIGVEAGLWKAADAVTLLASGLAERCLRHLLEPMDGEVDAALATVADIEAVLDAATPAPRLLHGINATAWPVLQAALDRGYDVRIGLEDTTQLPEGHTTTSNAALVEVALAFCHAGTDRRPAV